MLSDDASATTLRARSRPTAGPNQITKCVFTQAVQSGYRTRPNGKKADHFMVADAVYVERVSATKFPANREINRENRKIRPDEATRSSLNAANTGAFW